MGSAVSRSASVTSARVEDSLMIILLKGVYTPDSPLSGLRPVARHFLPIICSMVYRMQEDAIILDSPGVPTQRYTVGLALENVSALSLSGYYPTEASQPKLAWPVAKGRNVNMMPFKLGDRKSLPSNLSDYWKLIESFRIPKSENDFVCYLTIQESTVKTGTSQRRPGLHTESPGFVSLQLENGESQTVSGLLADSSNAHIRPGVYRSYICWGGGFFGADGLEGGIFMASNVSESCRVYHCRVSDPSLIGTNGNVEHLRNYLDRSNVKVSMIPANHLFWMTDTTPHESMPLKEDVERQYIRIVTHGISAWYAEHSTPNPLCSLPADVAVIQGSKF